MRKAALCVSFLLWTVSTARSDVVRLINGGELRGGASTTDSHVLVETQSGSSIRLPLDSVSFVAIQSEKEEEFDRRLMRASSADDLRKLAAWCRASRLRSERKALMPLILTHDPDDAAARRELGYKRSGGHWKTRDQMMREQGQVRAEKGYVTRQQRDRISRTTDEQEQETLWSGRISALTARSNTDPDGAIEALKSIRDPFAIASLTAFFRNADHDAVRAEYCRTLGQIGHRAVLEPLLDQAIFDEAAEVRQIAVDAVPQIVRERAAERLADYLRDHQNEAVNRAAMGLRRMQARDQIPALIEALITGHDYTAHVTNSEALHQATNELADRIDLSPPEVIRLLRSGRVPRRAAQAKAENATRIRVRYPHRNQAVHAALVALTGNDFGFDQRVWRLWLHAQTARSK